MMSSGVTDQEPTVVQPLFREPVNIGEWVELVVVVVLLRPSRRGLERGCTYRRRRRWYHVSPSRFSLASSRFLFSLLRSRSQRSMLFDFGGMERCGVRLRGA